MLNHDIELRKKNNLPDKPQPQTGPRIMVAAWRSFLNGSQKPIPTKEKNDKFNLINRREKMLGFSGRK
jgi:hypothetical protein